MYKKLQGDIVSLSWNKQNLVDAILTQSSLQHHVLMQHYVYLWGPKFIQNFQQGTLDGCNAGLTNWRPEFEPTPCCVKFSIKPNRFLFLTLTKLNFCHLPYAAVSCYLMLSCLALFVMLLICCCTCSSDIFYWYVQYQCVGIILSQCLSVQ